MYTARYAHTVASYVATFFIFAITAWMIRHIYLTINPEASGTVLQTVWLFTFISLSWNSLLALLEKPKDALSFHAKQQLDKLKVAALIPAYNEDPEFLKQCVRSILMQTRQVNAIAIVDDGSTEVEYDSVREDIKSFLKKNKLKTRVVWRRTANGGKRHAQMEGLKLAPKADVYITVDSDTVLDPHAIEEILKPMADQRITSVAGICVAINEEESIFTRVTGLWETAWQLLDRSAQSVMHSVTVNSGVIAAYRGDVIRKYKDVYLKEEFFGQPVHFSDDSLLTLYSMLNGRTVQQPTAVAFSAVPNKVSHHIRRYTRWMRGSFIRSWWRFKYLPLTSYAYWLHFWRWLQAFIGLIVSVFLVVYATNEPSIIKYLIFVPIFIGYGQSLRYLVIRRSDMSIWSQLFTWSLTPLAILWSLTVLRVVKWYAYFTARSTGWGTRQTVEVGLKEGA